MSLLVAMATDYGVAWLQYLVPAAEGYELWLIDLVAVRSPTEAVAKFGLLCLLPAFLEESLFRGICQTLRECACGKWIGLVLAACLFAAAHANWRYFPLYTLLGIFLGALYQWRRTLWLPAIAHLVNNTWTYATKAAGWSLPGLG